MSRIVLDLKLIFLNDGTVRDLLCELDFCDLEISSVKPFKTPVKASGIVKNRAGVVELKVELSACYMARCDRCGEESARVYKIPIYRTLVTNLENDNNEEFLLLQDFKLDFLELCRCELILGIPMKHLCSDECHGACVQCGKSLNKGQCDCVGAMDPRWDSLKQLLN